MHVTYYIYIKPNNQWSQFPEMKIEFWLDSSQFVNFDYQTSVDTSGSAHMLTRLIINGYESPLFRAVEANKLNWVTNQRSRKVWLNRGKHWARVDYRCNAGYIILHLNGYDYQTNYFEVEYYKVKA